MSEKNFVMPAGLKKNEGTATPTFARYEVGPFENGYGQTVGIALRRVLLSSIEGVAITAIRIKGADHEFTTVPGIAEDVTDIVIAIKQVLVKSAPVIPESIKLSKKGPCEVTAGDFMADNAVEIVNPDLHIATVAAGSTFELDAELALGYGFHMAADNQPEDQIIGQIPVDSIHSPVSRVNFETVAQRVGDRTDYEKLILDIWTDGRITPDDALHSGAALIRRHFDVFLGDGESAPAAPVVVKQEAPAAAPAAAASAPSGENLKKILATNIADLELGVRSSNCLNREEIKTVGQLACYSYEEMLGFRSFGQKSLDEIRGKLADLGLDLSQPISPELLAPYKAMNDAIRASREAKGGEAENAKAKEA